MPQRWIVVVEIVEREKIDLSKAFLVIAFPGTGMAGAVAGNFLWDSLKLRYIASVESSEFTWGAVVAKGQAMSPIRIGVGDAICGLDGNCDQLAVVVSEVPLKGPHILPTADAVLRWARDRKVREVLVLDALRQEGGEPSETVWGVCNSPKGEACLTKVKASRFTDGVLSGMTGVTLYKGSDYRLDVMCLLAESPGQHTDARAAGRLVEAIRPLLPRLKIDPEPLYAQAEVIEKVMRKNAEDQGRQARMMQSQADVMFG